MPNLTSFFGKRFLSAESKGCTINLLNSVRSNHSCDCYM